LGSTKKKELHRDKIISMDLDQKLLDEKTFFFDLLIADLYFFGFEFGFGFRFRQLIID